nr:hypothetical protein [Kofleriaceae bacterium]
MTARWLAAVAVVSGLACAKAGDANAIDAAQAARHDAAPEHQDAHDVGPRDAILPIDAPVSKPVDAAVPPADATVPPDGAIFCSDNSVCTDPGTCCFLINGSNFGFCTDGSVLFGVCFPTGN